MVPLEKHCQTRPFCSCIYKDYTLGASDPNSSLYGSKMDAIICRHFCCHLDWSIQIESVDLELDRRQAARHPSNILADELYTWHYETVLDKYKSTQV